MPDGKTITAETGESTYDVAARIGAGLARAAVGGKVAQNGDSEIYDLHRPLPGDCRLWVLTASDDNPDSLWILRHSAAHVMAEAICKLFPDTKLVYGPPVEDGFYYDIDLDRSITPEDFESIEQEMGRIIKEDRPFTRYDLDRAEALKRLEAEGNRYKVDNALRAEGDTLSFYATGEVGTHFEDLCRGPHIPSTGRIGAFKVRQVSGSHYRGDINEQALQRVYGMAFYKKASLAAYLEQLEQAKARDHRVLGKQLELFTISPEVGSGLVLWQPNGAIVRMLLENYMRDELLQRGYQPVYTPHIGRLELYRRSGHYPYYEDSQFPALYETDRGKALLGLMHLAQRGKGQLGQELEHTRKSVRGLIDAVQTAWGDIEGLDADGALDETVTILDRELRDEEGFLLRPMNCPHHIHIYKAVPRSYRDLPVRLAEFGTVYRYEQSGELAGLLRVRGFTQDDAHIFCTPEQLPKEIAGTVQLSLQILDVLQLSDCRIRLGLGDPASDKYSGNPELWALAEQQLRDVVRGLELDCAEEIGEAAFYGPKIDFIVRDCIGREWQLGTVQVDYTLPERFDLTYVGADNKPHRPIMIHRAPFGSIERLMAVLIEHYAGAFPLWLAPVQVGLVTVSEKSAGYAGQVHTRLLEAGLRAALDLSSEKIGPKKHRMRARKIPYILVVGEQEAADNSVNVNHRNGQTLGTVPLDSFLKRCQDEITAKGSSDAGMGSS